MFTVIIVAFLISCPEVARTDSRKPNFNILFIIVDDLRHLSDRNINLPSIKKLGNIGINFANAYAQQALCAPSRNSMLTGRRPDSLRLYDFYNYWRDTVGNFTTLPQLFKENGYETHSIGKVFHPGISSNFTDDYPYSWSQYPYHPSTDKYKDAAVCRDKITKKFQSNLICPVKVIEQPGGTLPDIESLDAAVNFLSARNRNKPFFLAVGFHKPHIPMKYPKEYMELIPINEVHPPKYPFMPYNMPLVSWHPWTDVRKRDDITRLNISFPWGTMPYKWSLKIRQSYYAATLYVDDLIGKLLSYIDMKETIVILTSDHGWSLGENGLWAKYSNFDVALKVPLIFSIPGLLPKNIHTPVELIDIFPTLADLSDMADNIPKCENHIKQLPLCFEGKSLKPLMTEMIKFKNNFALSQYPRPSVYPQRNSDKPRLKNIKIMGYSIRTQRYRYTEWLSFNSTSFTINWNKIYGVELYDHVKDRDEAHNVYLIHKYKNITQYLSRLLRSEVNKQ